MRGTVKIYKLWMGINDREHQAHHVSDERVPRHNGDKRMKSIRVISAAALLLFGIAAPARARQEKQQEKAKPAQQEQQAKPERQQQAQAPKQQQQHQQQAQAPKQQQQQHQQQAQTPKQQQPQHQQQAQAPKQQQQQHQQQAQAPKQQQQQHQQQAQAPKQQQQQQQARTQQQQPRQSQVRSSQPPPRTQQAVERQRSQPALRLSSRGSGRIPDDRFRSHFGREHAFHMGNPVLVGGYSRFQYNGFWFGFVEPWPVGWYYTDDVYIDYVDGGYYMYNPYYPGSRFSISVVI
jgi:hypothetical protein